MNGKNMNEKNMDIDEFLSMSTVDKESYLDSLSEQQEVSFLDGVKAHQEKLSAQRGALEARRAKRRTVLAFAWDSKDFTDVDNKVNIRKLTAVCLAVMEKRGECVSVKTVTAQVMSHVSAWLIENPHLTVGRGKTPTGKYLSARCSSILSDSSDGLLKVLPSERLGKTYVQVLATKYGG